MDPQTYAEFTWPWFVKNLPFPHNYYVPIQRHKHCVNRLKLTRGIDNASQCLVECETKVKFWRVEDFFNGTGRLGRWEEGGGGDTHNVWPLYLTNPLNFKKVIL